MAPGARETEESEPRKERRAPGLTVAAIAMIAGCELAVNTKHLDDGCPRPSVQVSSGRGSYCIDPTEVSAASYALFLNAAVPLPTALAPVCAGESFVPIKDWPVAPGREQFPATYVTWCDAAAYCTWKGGRLCGQTGGGPLDVSNTQNASLAQWYSACSQGGALAFPYGNAFDSNACGGADAGSQLAIVGSRDTCVGGYPGLHDMSGNVWEWLDVCDSNGATGFCRTAGGAFDGYASDLACGSTRNWTRSSGAANLGFRCCRDL